LNINILHSILSGFKIVNNFSEARKSQIFELQKTQDTLPTTKQIKD